MYSCIYIYIERERERERTHDYMIVLWIRLRAGRKAEDERRKKE
jgi:hypothetical protein